jgi:hypothetical protein
MASTDRPDADPARCGPRPASKAGHVPQALRRPRGTDRPVPPCGLCEHDTRPGHPLREQPELWRPGQLRVRLNEIFRRPDIFPPAAAGRKTLINPGPTIGAGHIREPVGRRHAGSTDMETSPVITVAGVYTVSANTREARRQIHAQDLQSLGTTKSRSVATFLADFLAGRLLRRNLLGCRLVGRDRLCRCFLGRRLLCGGLRGRRFLRRSSRGRHPAGDLLARYVLSRIPQRGSTPRDYCHKPAASEPHLSTGLDSFGSCIRSVCLPSSWRAACSSILRGPQHPGARRHPRHRPRRVVAVGAARGAPGRRRRRAVRTLRAGLRVGPGASRLSR